MAKLQQIPDNTKFFGVFLYTLGLERVLYNDEICQLRDAMEEIQGILSYYTDHK